MSNYRAEWEAEDAADERRRQVEESGDTALNFAIQVFGHKAVIVRTIDKMVALTAVAPTDEPPF